MSTTPGAYASAQANATGTCIGNHHIPQATVQKFMGQKTVNVPGVGNNIPVAIGHTITPLAGHSAQDQVGPGMCGKCYVVKSTKTGKMAVIMGTDGMGGLTGKTVGSDCSPEMTAAVADQVFGPGVCTSGRGDFVYKTLSSCPGV